ncbi:XRE family transcriptional regulator, partial [Dysosmobacter welbionis]
QVQLEKQCGLHRAVVVAGDLVKSQLPVEADGILQNRQGVQQHTAVADLPRVLCDPADQLPGKPPAPVLRLDVQALHFASLAVQPPQGDTARRPPVHPGQVQPSVRRGVLGGGARSSS